MQSEGNGGGDAWVARFSPGTPLSRLTSVSAASFLETTGAAANSIVSAFGPDLAPKTDAAGGPSLPTTLSGTAVTVKDSRGTQSAAPLLCVSSGQVNFLVPSGLA